MNPFKQLAEFGKPSIYKFIFLAEWLVFIVISLFQGKINTLHILAVAIYPLLLFYLIACLLIYHRKKDLSLLNLSGLILFSFGLTFIDQLMKVFVEIFIPIDASVSVIPGWFEITHRQNHHGAWIFTSLPDSTIPWLVPILKIILVFFTLMIIPIYQYLVSKSGKKFWPQVGFVCVFSAFLSWVVDMFMRGYIVDFIGLPGLVAADFKDILAYIGTAAIIMEAAEEPEKNLKWKGWNIEINEMKDFFLGVILIINQDLRFVFLKIMSLLKK